MTASVARTGLDHDDDPAGPDEGGDELLEGLRPDECAVRVMGLEAGERSRVRAVGHNDRVPVTGEVARQVAAHDGQADDTDVRCG